MSVAPVRSHDSSCVKPQQTALEDEEGVRKRRVKLPGNLRTAPVFHMVMSACLKTMKIGGIEMLPGGVGTSCCLSP